MAALSLYLVTVVVFLALDAVGLKLLIRPLFERHIPDMLAENVRYLPAAAFYLFYIAGIVHFASLPAFRAGAPVQALWSGMFLGAIAYGTYEFSNFATLRGWSLPMVATDLAWGIGLSGFSAWAGVALTSLWLDPGAAG